MMADSRRRRGSPESSSTARKYEQPESSTRRNDHNHNHNHEHQHQQHRNHQHHPDHEFADVPRSRQDAEQYPYLSSSSDSYELIDISRTFPTKRFGLTTFFTAPSERRQRLRRRRSGRLSRHSNSSSSSLDGDLAYGTGFLKRHKTRSVRSRKGKEIDRERERYSYTQSQRERREDKSDREKFSGSERRSGKSSVSNLKTEAEILAVGAGLAKLAREQNKLDLKAARAGKRPEVFAVKEIHGNGGRSRGLAGPSKISHGSDTLDEEGWESASDAETDLSVDSKLAFGNESRGGWGFFGRKKKAPLSRKESVVDPKLFGPHNSLHGIVTEPVGFDDVTWEQHSDFGQRSYSFPVAPNETMSDSQTSLQKVYPIPTTDPSRFEVAKSTVASGSEPYFSSRPDPAPLQHPQPRTPVSQSVYEPSYEARSESGSILKKTSSSGRSKSLAEAALVGVAGAAIGAAIVKGKDDRKERYREEEIREEERLKRRDSEKKESKDERRREKRSSPDREERREKRREKERSSRSSSDEARREKKWDKRRDSTRDEGRDERREKRREERRSARSDVSARDERDRYDDRKTKSEAAASVVSGIDPFMFQVADDAFPTPKIEPSSGHRKTDSVPKVVTVEREPDFTRKRSDSVKALPPSEFLEEYPWDNGNSRRDEKERDRTYHNAERIYQETEHSTAPIAAAAMGAAVAAVTAEAVSRSSRSEKRRDERRNGRSDYDERDSKPREYDDHDSKPRGRDRESEKERDPIQEEADRAYREIVMARKIASQVIRSRSASPDTSVVRKYDKVEEEEEPIEIVTPPGMEDHKKKGPYDAPNADFRPDYEIRNPRDLQNFSIPTINLDRKNPEAGYLIDADRPRPLLNLVHPTPAPSPLPEKQAARSESGSKSKSKDREESSRSETDRPSKSREREESSRSETSKSRDYEDTSRSEKDWSSKSRDRDRDESARSESAWSEPVRSSKSKDREQSTRTSASEVGKGDAVWSPTASTVKGVTWGENETKHFEVESPHEQRDEFVSSSDIKTREKSSEPKKSKSSGWGAIAAGIMGAGVGAAAASASDSSKTSKSKENDNEKDKPYEYRGVVVEPESPPRRRSPPATGPKPTSADASRIPGAFGDDLDFTATVAAGLQDTGFDPNIVIEDPTFRRRDSPPGSNEPDIYRTPYAETVSDLGAIPPNASGISGTSRDLVTREVDVAPRDEEDEWAPKLSKKEQKKRDKALKRQSVDATAFDDVPTPETEVIESYAEPKLSKKEQKKRDKEAKRQSISEDITPSAEPSVSREFVEEPESYFEPASSKKSKKKSKRDSKTFDDFEDTTTADASRDSRKVSVPVDAFDDLKNQDDEWATPKSKKKDKSKRKSVDQYEPDPADVSLPPSTPSETSRDGEYDERRSKKSSRDSGIFDSSERSSRYDDESRKSKKKSRSGTKDDFDDSRSVASAPAGDDEDGKKSKKGGFFGLFGSKSESGARDDTPKDSKDDFDDVKKKKKSKRTSMPDASSLYGDIGATSVNDLSRSVSNGHGDDDGVRSDGEKERKKTRSRASSTSSKRDSFLDRAGTLGAGAGIAGAAAVAAIAAQHHLQSKADPEHRRSEKEPERKEEAAFDPEIREREFRPSIDPQYGDLLPLPPSTPASPQEEPLDHLPDLPDSGPETPEVERLLNDRPARSSHRRSFQETPMKSPSNSAIPLKFNMGKRSSERSVPSSPNISRFSPAVQSPATPNPDLTGHPRIRHKPTSSWDSVKEYKPLYLVESNRHSNEFQAPEEETQLPELPPSQRTSRSSSRLDPDDEGKSHGLGLDLEQSLSKDLSLDTSNNPPSDLLDSQETTPKASVPPPHESFDTPSKIAAAAGLASTIGYFASSPTHHATKENWTEDLPSAPVDAMTKDRSSYLLNSSPMVRKMEEIRDAEAASGAMPKVKEEGGVFEYLQQEEEPQGPETPSKSLQRDVPVEDPVLPQLPREAEEAELADEFTFTKSKKDKKKDKKKGKLSRSSTQDDFTVPEPEPEAASIPVVETAPEEEFFAPKSKKDKKKSKGLSRSSTQDDITLPETGAETATDVLPTPGDKEPEDDDFSGPKSKKDKKKDKKKAKSASAWDDPEENLTSSQELQDAPLSMEEPRDDSRPSVAESDSFEVATSSKSKKDKKKDKKNRKSVSWEPDVSEPVSEPAEASREIVEIPSIVDDAQADRESAIPISETQDIKPATELETGAPSIEGAKQAPVESKQEIPILEEPAADLDANPTDDFTMTSKKSKKKDKKKGKASSPWEPEPEISHPQAPEDQPLPEPNRNLVDGATTTPDDFQVTETKKTKKEKRKSKTWEPEQEIMPTEPSAQEQFNLEKDATIETPPAEDFESFSTKKGKKNKKGKSKFSWGAEEETPAPTSSSQETQPEEAPTPVLTSEEAQIEQSARDIVPESPEQKFEDAEEFFEPTSKKSKKKSKKSQAWADDEALGHEPVAEEAAKESKIDTQDEPTEEIEQFVMPGSKKNKKKSKKAQQSAWEDDAQPVEVEIPHAEKSFSAESPAPTPAEEIPEEFIMPSSKKGKKKNRKSQGFDWAEEASPENVNVDEPTASNDNQRSSMILPVIATAVAGAAALAVHEAGKDKSHQAEATSEPQSLKSLNEEDAEPEQTSGQKPVPDGFASGYNNDQLSLAKQMQEEFASGSKKSKKDKKKRQSLPVTPDPESFRSRSTDEPPEPQQRARSLSIGPSASTDQKRDLYSEDQLELARQLQADFAKGNKKSKKDKKIRAHDLGPSTWDDAPDHGAEDTFHDTVETHDAAPKPEIEREEPKGDGFAAGYQEDQLSLARQLQAEFGSGSKKSKKDKKRRSTSQTPQEQDQRNDDYFGDAARPPVLDAPYSEEPTSINEATPRDEIVRDGLAVGYNEDQLELARQMREEFAAGSSKKSKKDKKDKKRQSLGRTNTEDDFSASLPATEVEQSLERDASAQDFGRGPSNELANAEPEDEFAFTTKKSKKDKKGKKRESLHRSTTDDAMASDAQESQSLDVSQPETPQEGDLAIEQPEDDFGFSTKKSKKDKKAKKRESLLRSTTDDGVSSDAVTGDPDTQSQVAQEISQETETVPAADEFEFSTKKSKKDKKNKQRDSLAQSTNEEPSNLDPVEPELNESRDIDTSQPSDETPREPEVELADEFAFTTKKSKKDKKGKKKEKENAFMDDEPASNDFGDAVEALHNSQNVPSEDASTEPITAVEDDWTQSSKKSKKDKKKRQSVQDTAAFEEAPRDVQEATESFTPVDKSRSLEKTVNDPIPEKTSDETNIDPPATEVESTKPEDGFEEFAFSSKKSKKDKKKCKDSSKLDSEEASGVSTPLEPPIENTKEVAEPVQEPEPSPIVEKRKPATKQDADGTGVWDAFSTKKSKKDKKKKKDSSKDTSEDPSAISTPAETVPVPESTENALDRQITEETREPPLETETSTIVQEPEEDDWASFTSGKKSKKDKKKRKSGISTPVETVPEASEPVQDTSEKPIEDFTIAAEEQITAEEPVSAEQSTATKDINAAEEDDWAGFSMKKSKKDKKKRKSGISTPLEEPLEPIAPVQEVLEERADEQPPTTEDTVISKGVDNPEQDNWDAFPTKKSKKDKKKRQSGLSTPIEAVPETVEPAKEPVIESSQLDKQLDAPPVTTEEPTPSLAKDDEPAEDDWASFPSKKSKKDKKKRQSGLSTPIESVPDPVKEVVAEEPSIEPPISIPAEKTIDELQREEWASFTGKKSKKDKKKAKSGVSTPVEEIPRDSQFEESAKLAAPAAAVAVAAIAASQILEEPSKQELPESQDKEQEPVDDEWASFSTKKSKKDKKKHKSGLSTPVEEAPVSTKTTDDKVVEEKQDVIPEDTLDISEEIRERPKDTVEAVLDEPNKAEPSTATFVNQDAPEEPVDDEWGSFTTKKSKKDKKKRKSGLSTPLEAEAETSGTTTASFDAEKQIPASNLEMANPAGVPELTPAHGLIEDFSKSAEVTESVPDRNLVEEPSKVDESATLQETEEPVDEWASFSTKKSKKDKKKRKSGVSTPAEEVAETPFELPPSTQNVTEETPRAEDSALPESREVIEEPVDDWAPISRKQSKKDKKRKSGIATPVEEPEKSQEISEPVVSREEVIGEDSAELRDSIPPASQTVGDEADAWAPVSRKQSKKDKKRKSGLTTPAEEDTDIAKEEASSAATREVVEEPSNVNELATSQDVAEEPTDEWASFSTKKSKKSKKDKKRDSGLSTPLEEKAEPLKPFGNTWNFENLEPVTSAKSLVEEPDRIEDPTVAPSTLETSQEPEDDWGSFSTKKSKKDKKKRNSGLSTPLEETNLAAAAKSQIPEPEKPIEEPSADVIRAEVDTPNLATSKEEERELGGEDLAFVTKRSKKDKKGKKGTRMVWDAESPDILDRESSAVQRAVDDGPSTTSEPQGSSRAELASIDPYIATKVHDAATSSSSEHLRNEEADVVSANLSRTPSKKDKRKRQATFDVNSTNFGESSRAPLTSWADEVEEAEVERNVPVIEDITRDESLSHIPRTVEATPVDDFVRPTKKGKKGKKRSGSITMANPPIGEESSKEQEHSSVPGLVAAGAALAGAALLTKSGDNVSEPSTPTTPGRKLSKKEKRKMSIDKRTPTDDMFDDPALWEGAEPKEFEDSKGQDNDDDGFWSPPKEETYAPPMEASREPEPAYDEPSRAPPTPPTKSAWEIEQPTLDSPRLGDIPSLKHPESQYHEEKHVDLQESPIERAPSRKSRYSTSFSDLPVVREESPLRHASDHHSKESHQSDDANRDSAFVTESPIPPQGAFADSHEHIRDSGVHMRDASPSMDARAPVSSSDAAIASLAWPEVDEEKETVDIQKSLRPKVINDKHHHEKSSHDPRRRSDRDIDFFSDHKSADDRSVKHHHGEPSSLNFLPSQLIKEDKPATDLHRTRTVHKSAEERPHRHHDSDFSDRDIHHDRSHLTRDEPHSDLHETRTIHKSAGERPRQQEEVVRREHHEPHREESQSDLHRTKTIHGHGAKRDAGSLVRQRMQNFESTDVPKSTKPKEESNVRHRVHRTQSPDSARPSKPKEDKYAELGQSQIPKAERPQTMSNDTAIAVGTVALAGAGLGFAAARQLSAEKRPDSAQGQRSISNINRIRTPDPKTRPDSANSHRSSGTPPLRRSDRKISGDLRSLSQQSKSNLNLAKEAAAAAAASTTSLNSANPTANEGRVRAKDMADVYDGFGEGRMGSPRSPTRPHSMRRRQSMQVLDLESKLQQLEAENRVLAEAKAQAERTLEASGHGSSSLVEKDAEIDSLKRTLDWLQNEVTRLTEVNDGLTSAHETLGRQHSERYGMLEAQHAQATRELQESRDAHGTLTAGTEGIVATQVQEKDQEIAQLRAQLENAKEQIREMQRQILASKAGDTDFLTVRDEDYFDTACQQLCQHVQQWVLRFSKFSDMRACRLTSEINNDKTIDRLDNAILDGSDVDSYLADRVKRRDVFMSMTMTMVWEFIFTRYLFGMDREQRQKLKSLEKLLSEVGPAAAVHQWRATTLTLLSKREAFLQQREQDTEAVVHAVLETLSEILPPPSHLEAQIEEQLKRVIKAAVDLSIEMRTQRAEYMMLPPLQPEYDANGDLASKVSFNAALMNERSGDTISNEELEANQAVVRVVLFPLVVKKGDDRGEGDEEIVVCPAQVLVAKPKGKNVRVLGHEEGTGSRMSLQSSMPEGPSVI